VQLQERELCNYCVRWSVGGVAWCFVCAGVAGVDRLIVARSAGSSPGAGLIGTLSSATAGPPKAAKPTDWPNVAAECNEAKKAWMINLLYHHLPTLYWVIIKRDVAAFVGVAAKLWTPSRAEAMPQGPMGGIDANEAGMEEEMIQKKVLNTQRVRRISGSFAFIEHRFLREGFLSSLSHHELILYVFLVLVADREGLSYYSYDKICEVLKIDLNDYLGARDGLIGHDLICFDGVIFQILSLPSTPISKRCEERRKPHEHVQIGRLFKNMLEGRS